MKLTELRYFVALAQEGTFSRAAKVCSVSQPSLSVAIAHLEEEFGVPLFERAKGRVTPTPVGEQVVAQARKALAEVDQVKTIARRGTDQLEGEFKLGVIHTVGPYLLPQLVPELTRVAPAMPLFIEEKHHRQFDRAAGRRPDRRGGDCLAICNARCGVLSFIRRKISGGGAQWASVDRAHHYVAGRACWRQCSAAQGR